MVVGALFWLAVAAMTMVSFQSPHAGRARPHRAVSASRPVFVVQPPVEESPWKANSIAANAMVAPDATAVNVPGDPRIRPTRRVVSVPSVRPAPAPRTPAATSAPADAESALALDALSRSRLETTF
jgi:hypothetical protein